MKISIWEVGWFRSRCLVRELYSPNTSGRVTKRCCYYWALLRTFPHFYSFLSFFMFLFSFSFLSGGGNQSSSALMRVWLWSASFISMSSYRCCILTLTSRTIHKGLVNSIFGCISYDVVTTHSLASLFGLILYLQTNFHLKMSMN